MVDQQIGAIIMKIGGGTLFGFLIIVLFFKWYNQEEGRAQIDATDREAYEH